MSRDAPMTLDDLAGRLTCSVPEAGQLLGIGKDAAYAAAARGEIPTLRLGRSLRVPVPVLLALLGVTTPDNNGAESHQDPAAATHEPVEGAHSHGATPRLHSA